MEPSNYAQLSLFFCLLCSGALVHACRSLWNSFSCIWPFSSANWVVEGVSGIQLVPYTTQVSFNSFPYHANHLLLRVQQQHLGLSLFLTCLTLSFKVIQKPSIPYQCGDKWYPACPFPPTSPSTVLPRPLLLERDTFSCTWIFYSSTIGMGKKYRGIYFMYYD